MQCQNCKKNSATIHLTEIVDGKRTETHICEQCAQKQGLAVKTQVPLNELLGTLLSSQPEAKGSDAADAVGAKCPHCGITFEQFRKQSVLGCPEDYKVFEKLLEPIIEKSQASKTSHCGKVPSQVPESSKKHSELLSLRQQLETAVRNEDYENAADLRDRINKLQCD